MEMLRTVVKAWKIPDMRKKLIFTLANAAGIQNRFSDTRTGHGQRRSWHRPLTARQGFSLCSTCSQAARSVTSPYLH